MDLPRIGALESLPAIEHPDLLATVADGIPTTPAELLWGDTHEGALDADDLLDRRSRIGLVPADRARAQAAATAAFATAANHAG